MSNLWKHQIDAINMARGKPCHALFHDVGVGKSRSVIEMIRNIFNDNKKFHRTLILCPVIVIENWKKEILKYSNIPKTNIVTLHGDTKDRIKTLEYKRRIEQEKLIVITNYDAVVASEKFGAAIQNFNPEILVCDESQRLKDIKARRTKYAIKISEKAAYRFLLSGSPFTNGPIDVFSQYLILDRGETFGKNFFVFRAKYFYDKNANMPKQKYFPDWRVRPSAIEEINELIFRKASRAVKSECLDLPPLVKQKVYVELSPMQRKLYEEMKKDLITFLNDEAVTAEMALTKALRLSQIVTGFVKTETGEVIEIGENPRAKALKELLQDIIPNKVIIWSVFIQNYAQIKQVCNELKIKYVEATGQTKAEDKFKNAELFCKDPEIKVFIGHPQSLGIGINLVEASYTIMYSRNYSYENDVQSEARNYRAGSEIHEKITRIDIVAKNTIDELILHAIESKEKISKDLLRKSLEGADNE